MIPRRGGDDRGVPVPDRGFGTPPQLTMHIGTLAVAGNPSVDNARRQFMLKPRKWARRAVVVSGRTPRLRRQSNRIDRNKLVSPQATVAGGNGLASAARPLPLHSTWELEYFKPHTC